MPRLRGLPGCGQRCVQSAALLVRQIVAFIVGHELHDRAFGQGGWLVKDEAPFLYTRSQRTHTGTVRVSAGTCKLTDVDGSARSRGLRALTVPARGERQAAA